MTNKTFIYDNYNLWENYHEDCKNSWEDMHLNEDITNSDLWDEIYFADEITWRMVAEELVRFFNDGYFLATGNVGLWNGNFSAGTVFIGWYEFFNTAVRNCDYWKIWDENGRFFFKCSHHDGTNVYEIKKLTDAGYNLWLDYEYDEFSVTSEQKMHQIIWNHSRLSQFPCFVKKFYK